jgi:Ni/Fe-hydrogenase subunit HybB-like protein
VWKWYVPAYFYVGGASGAAAALGAALQMADRRGHDGLIRRCRWIAALGGAAGTALLIADLGRPSRFLNMLRVFRPTSPMNLGSWVLSTVAPSAAASALFSSPGGLTGFLGDVSGLAAGASGIPLAGYTAVLVANTAVPVWQQSRRTLPPLFVSSAVAGAASLLQLMELDEREARVARRFAIVGAAGELASELAVDRDAARVERVAAPLHEGKSGLLLRISKACAGGSLLLNLLPGRSRTKRFLAGLFGTLGSLAVKFGIAEAGKASAADPRATFHQQRAGLGGAEATSSRAATGP